MFLITLTPGVHNQIIFLNIKKKLLQQFRQGGAGGGRDTLLRSRSQQVWLTPCSVHPSHNHPVPITQVIRIHIEIRLFQINPSQSNCDCP